MHRLLKDTVTVSLQVELASFLDWISRLPSMTLDAMHHGICSFQSLCHLMRQYEPVMRTLTMTLAYAVGLCPRGKLLWCVYLGM